MTDCNVEKQELPLVTGGSIWDISERKTMIDFEEARTLSEPAFNNIMVRCGSLCLEPRFITMPEINNCFVPNLQQGFRACGLSSRYKIQRYCFPYLVRKDNLVVYAEKGSGKTTAALMMAVGEVTKAIQQSTFALAVVVCRTCESAQKSYKLLCTMAQFCPNIKIRLAIRGRGKAGGTIIEHVIVGTPDKILQLSPLLKSEEIRLLVLDEVEAVESDRSYYERMIQISNDIIRKQTILLCAVPPRSAIEDFVNSVTRIHPHSLEFPFCRKRYNHKQIFVECSSYAERLSLVKKAASREGQIVVICESREMCFNVAKLLENMNEKVVILNGKVKGPLEKIVKSFKEGTYRILVITRNFTDLSTERLHTVVNCDIILTPDNSALDHAIYNKHMNLLTHSRPGCLLNVIRPSWVGYALDHNGAKLRSVRVNDLQI